MAAWLWSGAAVRLLAVLCLTAGCATAAQYRQQHPSSFDTMTDEMLDFVERTFWAELRPVVSKLESQVEALDSRVALLDSRVGELTALLHESSQNQRPDDLARRLDSLQSQLDQLAANFDSQKPQLEPETGPPTSISEPTEPPTSISEPTEPPTSISEPTEPPTNTPEPTEPPARHPSPVDDPQCVLPLRPNEDQDITENSGQRFGNKPDSRWEFSKLPSKMHLNSSISVEYKTTAREGIIFYAAAKNQIDFIALYVKDGKIVYALNCDSGTTIISSDRAYNDNFWHTARFDRSGLRSYLYIDDELVASGGPLGSYQLLQVHELFYIGGLSEEVKESERLQRNVQSIRTTFIGCLRNPRMDNINFNNPTKSVGVTPCSNNVEEGTFFSVEGGYLVAARRFRVGPQTEIELEVRPRKLGGVLLAVHGKKDFLTLQMLKDGSLRLTVENGRGEVTAVYTATEAHQLCDGNWHKIKVVKVQNVAVMNVDDQTSPPVFGVAGASSTDTNSPLYVGGVPSHNLPGITTNEQFVGCIRNLWIAGKPAIKLTDARVFGAVTANTCPLI